MDADFVADKEALRAGLGLSNGAIHSPFCGRQIVVLGTS